ncbi:MAG: PHP domain-containing protein [Candidatus Hadarchaeota archaeon]
MISLDLHVHTVYSGDSPCSVQEAVLAGKDAGLDGIAITDHNSVEGLREAREIGRKHDFLVIPGIEVSSNAGHILGLGIRNRISEGLSAKRTVELIHAEGGIAVSAHPFSLDKNPFSPLKAEFDAIEVFNPRRFFGNRLAKKYAQKHNIPFSAGSDSHFKEEVGLAGIKIESKPELNEVIKKIAQGKASVFGRYLPPTGYLRRALFRVSA